MTDLLALPVALPLVGAALTLLLRRRRGLQRSLALAILVASLGACIALLVEVDRNGIVANQVGAWPAPFGITLVVDMFSAMMLVVSAAVVLLVHVFAIHQKEDDELSPFFDPVYLTLAAGVSWAYVTGDLFNLFVAFEITLVSSYVLITLGGRRAQVRTGMTYVVLNLLGSTMFLATVGLVYAATGTVNMADLIGKFDTIPVGLRTALGLMLLIAFGVKAAVFPLFSWLPDSYPTAPSPITAVFAGLLTKVGVYAIIRTQTFYFAGDRSASVLLMLIAGSTMVVGILGAIAQNDMKRILSFDIVSQVGYMLMGLSFFTVAGLAGAIFFIVHHIPVKTGLFLVSGIVEHSSGTASLRRLSGLGRILPFTAALFLLVALSLVGIPPFSGFVAKLALVEAGFGIDQWTIVGASLLVSLLTLFLMLKIWSGVFWGPVEPIPGSGPPRRPPWTMLAATAGMVALTLAIALGGNTVYGWSDQASRTLLEPDEYVKAVLP